MDRSPDVVASLTQLVATLAQARQLTLASPEPAAVAALLSRARAELDVADEQLLALDRNRRRSAFRQAQRIRSRLEVIEGLVGAPPVVGSPGTPEAEAA